jgi:tetratricopeptide (TPR) repeat protein
MDSLLGYLVLLLSSVFLISSLLLGLSLGKKESSRWPRFGRLLKARLGLFLVASISGLGALVAGFVQQSQEHPVLETVATPLGTIGLKVSEDTIHREISGAAVEKIKETEAFVRQAERDFDAEHYEEAVRGYEAALKIIESRSVYLNLSLTRLILSQFSLAETAAQSGLTIVDRPTQEPTIEAALYNSLGIAYLSEGNQPEALRALLQAEHLFARAGALFGKADAIANIGIVFYHQGKYKDALSQHEKALTLHRQIGHDGAVANDLLNLGNVHLTQHRLDDARKRYTEGYEAHERSGNSLGMANALGNLGNVLLELGDPNGALTSHEKALAIHRSLVNRLGEANDLVNLGNVHLETKDLLRAQAQFEAAAKLADEIGSRRVQANATPNLALVKALLGDSPGAIEMFRSAISLHQRAGSRLGEAKSRLGLAEVLLRTSNTADGLHEMTTAHQAFFNLGLAEEAQRIERRLAEFGSGEH